MAAEIYFSAAIFFLHGLNLSLFIYLTKFNLPILFPIFPDCIFIPIFRFSLSDRRRLCSPSAANPNHTHQIIDQRLETAK